MSVSSVFSFSPERTPTIDEVQTRLDEYLDQFAVAGAPVGVEANHAGAYAFLQLMWVQVAPADQTTPNWELLRDRMHNTLQNYNRLFGSPYFEALPAGSGSPGSPHP